MQSLALLCHACVMHMMSHMVSRVDRRGGSRRGDGVARLRDRRGGGGVARLREMAKDVQTSRSGKENRQLKIWTKF
jgi:hypothetical protein